MSRGFSANLLDCLALLMSTCISFWRGAYLFKLGFFFRFAGKGGFLPSRLYIYLVLVLLTSGQGLYLFLVGSVLIISGQVLCV